MKQCYYKNLRNNFLIVAISLFIVSLLFFISFSQNKIVSNNKVKKIEKEVDIEKVIQNYANNRTIYKKNIVNNDLISMIFYDENNLYSSYIIDFNTNEELKITDLIKPDEYDNFQNKVMELLTLKYPTFIVETIKNNEGNIAYEIKANEMIIYYQNYPFNPPLQEEISLKVNYNEIKEYLNFTYKLDNDYQNESGYDYDKNKKSVAITFDDGPNGNKTLAILQALADNKMHATFFMVGNKLYNGYEVVKKVYQSGNEVGSHTYSHINMQRITQEQIDEELAETNKVFKSITGGELHLIRPPYGAYDDTILKQTNYPFIAWNLDTNDWKHHDVEYIVNHVLNNVKDGSIILMHDSYTASVEATKKLLPLLYARGYQVVSVSELASLKGTTLENNQVYSFLK